MWPSKRKSRQPRKPIGMPSAAAKAGAIAASNIAAEMIFGKADATLVAPNDAVRMIGLGDIEVPPSRMRALREEAVGDIAESIQARGRLLQPIIVRPRKGRKGEARFRLVAGRHRFEAVRKLAHDHIAAVIVEGLDADKALLAEIDENLIRAELSPAERAAHIGRRKELYEKLHPETKHGGAPAKRGEGGGAGKQSRQNGDSVVRFTKDTSKKTGRSERDVQRDATRADKVVVLPEVVGTSLDRGAELDALSKLPPDEQRKLAEQAKGDEEVSAKATAPPPDEMLVRVSAYIAGLGERGKHFMREAILEHARRIIADGKGDIEAARKALASFQ